MIYVRITMIYVRITMIYVTTIYYGLWTDGHSRLQ